MKSLPNERLTCPCCEEKTLSERDGYEICPICLWEDDPIQSSDPLYEGGANGCSLVEARNRWVNRK
ncbi:CPCC family cysteine-rich protein [Ralstonia pseudosolanacearum]|uniref:CPCC family cysteine-rich protein n=1 Tax=Ralstonia pseudosolanacearum TaxID=1310165 RepID=UPI00270E0F19|nr:CPCC family cysteine-rich protein [Ralstonia pseudosolanacearum]MDO3617323.1 CPCC family cysteine-rich protein [Ralstonia pseudosolanacearum]